MEYPLKSGDIKGYFVPKLIIKIVFKKVIVEISVKVCYTKENRWRNRLMGLLPMDADILPPSDDRIFKLILTSPKAKAGLIKLISAIIGRDVVDVTLHPNELPPESTEEKAERWDINGKIADGSQVNLEMQASRMQEDAGGQQRI